MNSNRDAIFELVVLKKEAESQSSTDGEQPDHQFMIARDETITTGSEEGRSYQTQYMGSNGPSFDNATYETSTDAFRASTDAFRASTDAFRASPKPMEINSHMYRRRCAPIVGLLVAAAMLGVITGVSLASYNYILLDDLEGVVAVHENRFNLNLEEMAAKMSDLNDKVGTLSDQLEEVSANLSIAESALQEMVLMNKNNISSLRDSFDVLDNELHVGLVNGTRRQDDLENQTDLRIANLTDTIEALQSQLHTLNEAVFSNSVNVFGNCTEQYTLPSSLSSSDEAEPTVYTVTTESVPLNGTVSVMLTKNAWTVA